MRVAMWYNNRDVRIEEMPVPEIGTGELLVRIEASGICGSDVMEWYRLDRAPLVLGHEIGGQVVEVGEGVYSYQVGDRILVRQAQSRPLSTSTVKRSRVLAMTIWRSRSPAAGGALKTCT